MIYEYKCTNDLCEYDTFTIYQSIKEDPLKICPYCNETSVERTFHAVTVITNSEPTTLGALAERNNKKFGKQKVAEMEHELKQERMRCREYCGRLPSNAKELPTGIREQVDLSLNKLTSEQKQKYILTGEK